ncbi:MAG: Dps family protein [Parvularculaceae bacterium]
MTSIETGLDADARAGAAEALKRVLADTYALYFKTHAFHWNVSGPQFHTLHLLFEEQYRDMWAALDVIAERIRALGVLAPASGKAFGALAAIEDADEDQTSGEAMVKFLLADHEALIRRAREALAAVSQAGDAASEDLLVQRIQIHEKFAWMLRALTQ